MENARSIQSATTSAATAAPRARTSDGLEPNRRVKITVTCPAGQTCVLVKIVTDAGVHGVGEGTKNGREPAVAALLEHHLAPTLIGRDPGAIEDIWKYLYRGAYWRGGPIQMAALAALDMALWDIKGKVAGLPVYSLLGGPTRTPRRSQLEGWVSEDAST